MTRGVVAALLLFSQSILAQPYVISTVAGGNPAPAGISAVRASIPLPSGVAVDAQGAVYFSSNNAVYKIDATGNLVRLAGTSRAGYAGDGGAAINAQIDAPFGVARDTAGNLYIADSGNHRIRKVSPTGNITTVAGNGNAGYSGDDGPATNAQLNAPVDVAVDAAGNLYIADSFNQRVRKVTTGGTISTIAGDGTCCYSGDNGPAIKAQMHQPGGVAVDGAGNVYIADLGNNRVRKVTPAGGITTVAGTGASGINGDNVAATSAQLKIVWAVAVDAGGTLYIADGDRIRKVSGGTISTIAGTPDAGFAGDGAAATKAQLSQPFGVAVDTAGNVYAADTGNSRIRKVAAGGTITTVAGDGSHNYSGDGGAATSAQIYEPQGIALGPGGVIYVSDYARVRKFTPGGPITTVAGSGAPIYSGDGGAAVNAQLVQPIGLTVDPASGTLYIADSGNNRVRKVSADGTISLVAGTGTAGYAGDNGPASAAMLRGPDGLALDAVGNLYVSDSGNGSVRKITPGGTITTVAGNGTLGLSGDGGPATSAQLTFPRGLVVDASGNLYIADFGNNRVRRVSVSGTITTVAGNGGIGAPVDGSPATSAGLGPQGVALDGSGNLYIADLNNAVWKVSPGGTIVRIAGTGDDGYTGDGGSGVSARVSDVRSVAVDSSGSIYLADTSNDAVRMLRPVSALLTITSPSQLPAGSVGAAYTQQLAATGGTATLTWSVIGGSLPAGLTLSPGGLISGTPSAAGTANFTVRVSDGGVSIATFGFSITITLPSITTFPTLLQGTVGLNYSQTLSATGGAPPYTWTLVSGALPPGLTLASSGLIAGTPTSTGTSNFTVRLADGAGSTATQSFTLLVLAAPPLARSGVMAHIAAGGGWSTAVYLLNTTSNQVSVAVALRADDGSALTLPLTVTQQGTTQEVSAAAVNAVIGPNATLVMELGTLGSALVTGWVEVATSGPVSGYAIFRNTFGAVSEGTSPLQTQFQSKIDVPYDNRGGFVTAVALANLAGSAVTVTATMWDSTGTLLGTQTIPVAANGHTAFVIPVQLPRTAGLQGIVQFQSSAGNLAGVGLRVSPQGTFTSVPVVLP